MLLEMVFNRGTEERSMWIMPARIFASQNDNNGMGLHDGGHPEKEPLPLVMCNNVEFCRTWYLCSSSASDVLKF